MNFYRVLNVPVNADRKEIDAAFRLLASKWYPPNSNSTNCNVAEAKFKEVCQAYEVLSNKDVRAVYNEILDFQLVDLSSFRFSDPYDVYDQFFGTGSGAKTEKSSNRTDNRGRCNGGDMSAYPTDTFVSVLESKFGHHRPVVQVSFVATPESVRRVRCFTEVVNGNVIVKTAVKHGSTLYETVHENGILKSKCCRNEDVH